MLKAKHSSDRASNRANDGGPDELKANGASIARPHGGASARAFPSVEISPAGLARRSMMVWPGMAAELIQFTAYDTIECRFRAPAHLLAAHEQGARRNGETFVEGLPRSTLRNLARKLTLVPAGCDYHEWLEPRTSIRLFYIYIDPMELRANSNPDGEDLALAPRLFFEDATLWSTILKLKRLFESQMVVNRLYIEALGVMLMQELLLLGRKTDHSDLPMRGGLAPWQQQAVITHIEAHLAEQIPLATLADLARLSPYYFCRAFKHSFGVPPHRYHIDRRIERAKELLMRSETSVTDVALAIGFSETSSFSACFRKMTGFAPSRYRRHIA
jgi:AraC family transcriptional regulator